MGTGFVFGKGYCVQTSKWNINGVIQNGLFKTMLSWKGLPGFFNIKQKEGERELDSGRDRDRERESAWGIVLQQEKDSVANKTNY